MQFNPEMLLWAMVAGMLLVLFWIALILLGAAWNAAWNWIDDYEQPRKNNPVIRVAMLMLGYKLRDCDYFPYVSASGGDSEGAPGVGIPMLILFCAPFAILICIFLYEIPLTLISLYLIARVARFSRRHKKLFDKHLKDPAAHK